MRCQAQDALRQAKAVLEQRVAERTAELTRINQSLVEQIAERKLADERIKGSEARLQAFMRNSPTLIFTKDLGGRYLHVNEEFTRSFGLDLNNVLSHTDDEIFPPDQAAQCKASDAHALIAGKAVEAEEISYHADGMRTQIVCKFPLFDSSGRVTALGGIATDITARVEIERALRESEAQLRELLGERNRLSRDLHDGIVQEIYAIGLGLEETRRLLSSDAHEVRERLAMVIGQLNKVIRDVRSHISGFALPGMSGWQLRDELDALIAMLRGAHPIRISLDIDPGALPRLSAEHTRHLLNIVREAVGNTLRHSHGSVGRVSLWRHGNGVRLTIEDDGIGFAVPEAVSRGHGLRNIAKRAEQLGAQIEILSTPGKGTRIVALTPSWNDN